MNPADRTSEDDAERDEQTTVFRRKYLAAEFRPGDIIVEPSASGLMPSRPSQFLAAGRSPGVRR